MARNLTRSWLRNSLVVAQVAFSLLLLLPAGLVLRGLQHVAKADPGYDANRVLFAGYSLELSNYDEARARAFNAEFVKRLEAIPGVQSVSLNFPPAFRRYRATITLADAGSQGTRTVSGHFSGASRNYFATLGIPIQRGRAFLEEEFRGDSSVAVISQSTADNLWPRENPLGKTVRLESGPNQAYPALTVVGVARDAQTVLTGQIPPVFFYLPQVQSEWTDLGVLVRTSGSTQELKSTAAAILRESEPTARLFVRTLEEDIAQSELVLKGRAISDMAASLGLLALTLASVGLYGVVAFSVSQRTREIGIRMALGAQHQAVMRMVFSQGLRLVALGVVLGTAGGWGVARLFGFLLFGVSPFDPLACAGVALLLAGVTGVAMYVPARRAAKIDPMVALRYE